MSRLNQLLQVAVGLVVVPVIPIVTLWLAAPLSVGCSSSWVLWNNFYIPNFCSLYASPLVIGLTLPTFVPGLVACVRKVWPFGLTGMIAGALLWFYLIESLFDIYPVSLFAIIAGLTLAILVGWKVFFSDTSNPNPLPTG